MTQAEILKTVTYGGSRRIFRKQDIYWRSRFSGASRKQGGGSAEVVLTVVSKNGNSFGLRPGQARSCGRRQRAKEKALCARTELSCFSG